MRNAIVHISGLLKSRYDKSPIDNINDIVNEITKRAEFNILTASTRMAIVLYTALTPAAKVILCMNYYDSESFINSIFNDIPNPDRIFDKDILICKFNSVITKPGSFITYDEEVNFDRSVRFNQLMNLFNNSMDTILAINQVVYDNDISNDDRCLYFEKCMNIDDDIATLYCEDCIGKIATNNYRPFNPHTIYDEYSGGIAGHHTINYNDL